ncbi:MAG TPA: hypothetical protein VMX12_00140 [Acidimicrobiia bacterium]|nr:hypothetical protein [Acidimicrobiia bacterium]
MTRPRFDVRASTKVLVDARNAAADREDWDLVDDIDVELDKRADAESGVSWTAGP